MKQFLCLLYERMRLAPFTASLTKTPVLRADSWPWGMENASRSVPVVWLVIPGGLYITEAQGARGHM